MKKKTTIARTGKSILPSPSALVVIAALQKQADPWRKKVEALPIKTKDEYDTAALLLSNLKQLGKQAKIEEDGMTTGIKQSLKAITAHFQPFYIGIEATEKRTKERMVNFLDGQEAKVVKLHSDFNAGKIKRVGTVVAKENDLQNVSNEDASVRKIKTLDIFDAKKIPREYMVPDEVAIKRAFQAGRVVPGCKMVLTKSIAI